MQHFEISKKIEPYLWLALLFQSIANSCTATHEHLCLEDDYTNELPIFIEKRIICNFETVPVLVYSIKLEPDLGMDSKLCLKGEFAETFNITAENDLKLFGPLEQTETVLKLQIIKTSDIAGTPGERRQAINAVKFILNIVDCGQVTWQTILVAILSSVCVALMSSLAIMLILYQQKGLIKSGNDDERAEDMSRFPAPGFNDETFINPRRTSSYEFSSLSKQTNSTLDPTQETENL